MAHASWDIYKDGVVYMKKKLYKHILASSHLTIPTLQLKMQVSSYLWKDHTLVHHLMLLCLVTVEEREKQWKLNVHFVTKMVSLMTQDS